MFLSVISCLLFILMAQAEGVNISKVEKYVLRVKKVVKGDVTTYTSWRYLKVFTHKRLSNCEVLQRNELSLARLPSPLSVNIRLYDMTAGESVSLALLKDAPNGARLGGFYTSAHQRDAHNSLGNLLNIEVFSVDNTVVPFEALNECRIVTAEEIERIIVRDSSRKGNPI